jgi:succinyl-diaminopimelate desuccinylase
MKEKLFKWIDEALPLAIELETELTKRPAIAPESGGEGELDKCLFLEQWLKTHGITKLERYDAPDSRAKGGVRPNLIAVIEGSDKENADGCGCLWIMSHTDIVPPGEKKLWESDPYTVIRAEDPPRLIGRGVEDNQQGLVSSVLAALAFTSQSLKPARTIKLLFAADEETGSGYGADWLAANRRELFNQNDMALVPDIGDKTGASIEIAEKNILWVNFITKGIQTHGSRPDLGANAHLAGCDLAMRLHIELGEIFYERDPLFEPCYSTFQPTKKEANVPNVNTIPGEDLCSMDMRVLPRYSTKQVLAEIDRIKKEIERKYGVRIEYTLSQNMESKPTSVDSAIYKLLSGAVAEVYSVEPKPVGAGGGTVAAFLRNIGIDCAVWARLCEQAHQPNEYVLLENIISDAKVMALLGL